VEVITDTATRTGKRSVSGAYQERSPLGVLI
jgi:hypothetical protein